MELRPLLGEVFRKLALQKESRIEEIGSSRVLATPQRDGGWVEDGLNVYSETRRAQHSDGFRKPINPSGTDRFR